MAEPHGFSFNYRGGGSWMRRARPAAKGVRFKRGGNRYGRRSYLKEVFSKLLAISSYSDLKAIRLQMHRRERELDAQRAAQFEPEAEVCISNRGRPVFGVVQRSEGGNVLVRMAHGFVARIPAAKVRLTRRSS
jgi:hypothetical protein